MTNLRERANRVSRHRAGILLAVATAIISGFAVFINGYGVRAWSGTASPTTYTTFKNAVAALVLVTIALVFTSRGSREGLTRPTRTKQWLGLGLVATLGGAAAFALFFEGLSRASSSQAAFIHKTLVIWVLILAVGLLRESVKPLHIAAIGLLVAGQFLLIGGVSEVSFGIGEAMMLGATLLWSIGIIIAKRLLAELSSLTVGVARMAGGAVVLAMYGIASGGFGAMGAVSLSQVGWVLLTGVVLSGYVGTWYAALARAPALDVTSILVGGAVLTALLKVAFLGASISSPIGLAMVTAGVLIVVGAALAPRAPQPAGSTSRS